MIRGRASARLLRPLLDDFIFDHRSEGTTRLVGEVTDAAHLHGQKKGHGVIGLPNPINQGLEKPWAIHTKSGEQ